MALEYLSTTGQGYQSVPVSSTAPLPVTLAGGISVTGSIAATNGTVTIPVNGQGTVGVSITGTWTGALTIKASVDYASVGAAAATFGVSTGVSLTNGTILTAITANGLYQINAAGFTAIQIFGTNLATGGPVNVVMVASGAVSTVMADNPFPVTQSGNWGVAVIPAAATPVTVSATGTTLATAAILPGVSNKTTYLCGFSIRANATAAATGNATVVGAVTGTLNFTQWTAPLASGIGVVEPPIETPIPASATNTGFTITSAAPGSGGTVSVTAWGYQL